jgi:hypothetical protein
MRAEHHDFVLEPGIGARNLGEDVVGVAISVEEARLHVHAQLHRHAALEQPRDHVVVLADEHDLRQQVVGRIAAGLHEQRAVLAAARTKQDASASGSNRGVDALLRRRRPARGATLPAAAALSSPGRSRRGRLIGLFGRLHAIGANEVRHDRLRHDGRALELRLHALDVFRGLAGERHHRRDDFPFRRRAPRLRIPDERHVPRFDHFEHELVERPATAELERLEPRVRETPADQLVARPLGRAFVLRRSGEPRTDHVDELIERRLHARSVQPLVANLRDDGEVDGLGRLRHDRGGAGPGERGANGDSERLHASLRHRV